jgi:hypothetical protein
MAERIDRTERRLEERWIEWALFGAVMLLTLATLYTLFGEGWTGLFAPADEPAAGSHSGRTQSVKAENPP